MEAAADVEQRHTQGVALDDKQAGALQRQTGGGSSCPPGQENCWGMFSTVSLTRLVWDTGTSRNQTLSVSPMSTRHSHKLRFWTTRVGIGQLRELAVAFVALCSRSVAVQSCGEGGVARRLNSGSKTCHP